MNFSATITPAAAIAILILTVLVVRGKPSAGATMWNTARNGMREHASYGRYGWFSFPTAKRAHAVWAWDEEIERRALCGACGGENAEWDDPGDKPWCPKCAAGLKPNWRRIYEEIQK